MKVITRLLITFLPFVLLSAQPALAQTGSLQVTISPQGAIDAGAKWRVDSRKWQDSNYIETGLSVGSHTVSFKEEIDGWSEPNSQTVQIYDGQTTITTGTYMQQFGSLQVTILPPEAVTAGAQWRVDGGPWHDSNYTEPNIVAGDHEVEFSIIDGWMEPNTLDVFVTSGLTTTTSGTYTALSGGSLQVTILPQAAIDANAQWRVDGGTWHDSDYTEPNLTAGFHNVEYKPITDWKEPNSETVQIFSNQTTTTSGTYLQAGSLQVTISPPEAIIAGAQWRVDGGAWHDSNDTESNLAIGLHTIEYKQINNWNEPNSEIVQINYAQTTTTSGTYIQQLGSLKVTISPQAAIDAGAQWRLDGGTWQESGYTEPNLGIGSHTVEYKPITGWNEPSSQIVQINDGQTTTTSGTYIQQFGSLQVTISPQAAIDAGAQWRVDGGAWHDSNDTEPNLGLGSHTVEYKPITGWNEPSSQIVQINDGQTTTTTGTYTLQEGSLQVTISPQAAIDAGAQWRVDGGTWQNSGYTEPNLAVGSYTVEYSVITGWNEPNSETVQINDGQTTTTTGTYTAQAGSLQVTISPQAAIDAGAQWRVDGGAWHDSNDTEPNLGIGSHTVEYKPITGWNEPSSQIVQINDGQTTTTTGTYTAQAGSLQVTISPQAAIDAGAQWRVDDGPWQNSGYTEPNLAVGTHTVEYSVITGWNEPNSETVQINDGQTTTTTGTYTLQEGSLQVTISPQAAIDAGAQWRVDGGPWQNSGYTEPNLAVGSYTVEYSVITGWNEPNSETVQINDGQTTTTTGTYTLQEGSLQVTISPQAAIDAGAQWRVDGGPWQNSGYTEPNLAVGSYTVEYSVITGWNEPNSETVQINDGQTTTTTGTYTLQEGSLQVTISPQAAIDAGAQWRVDGGPWQNSGYTEPNLAVGTHTVEYSVITGWNEPNSETVQINDGQTTTTTGTYTAQAGSLQVTISPQAAIDAGAQWRVDDGAWQNSGYTEPNLAVGTHTVEYSVIAGWNEPNSETVQINDGQTTTTTGTYTLQEGSLQVTISPQAAIDAGAQWRVDGGAWQNSGYTEPNLTVGTHTVEYSVITGWNEPNSETVQINDGQTTTTTGTYTAQAGSLQVTISPQAAIDAGAQWRVDGGAWHDSNDTEPNLGLGSHTVEYKPITGWNEPSNQIVQINDDQTTTTTGTYTAQAGSLQVTISPQAAIDAGAQWRVDGGAWQNSGYTEPNLAVGTHTVEYSVITGWNEPNSETVQINDGQTTTTTGTYTAQAGSLQVTISPQAAIDAGAQWRVDGGAWQDSGYTEPNLAVGSHTVEYSVIAGFNEPNSETVQINDGQTTTTTGTYTAQAGSLQVTISPPEAIAAGAQWRVDGGAWQDSGYTEPNLAVGSHTVEYSVITGWNEPNSETVQINDGQTTTTTGTYTAQAGSLQVTISPPEAIAAGAQWRVDGGAWQDSGYTEPNLAVGTHTVEYSVIAGWNEPNSETVQINDGQTTTTTGTYTAQAGSLQVTISPQAAIDAGAQWRVDGGPWQNSGYTEPNLAVGSYTVEYSVITGWNEPNSETVQINDGQTTTTTGTYTAQAGSLQVTISPQAAIDAGAQWRVDGGPWQNSGYTEPNLAVGSYTVEYSVITGWNEPNSETVQINDGQTTTTTGTYTAQAGSLQVTISPQAAIDAGAHWRVDGGAWQESGYTEPNLTVGSHTVEYSVIAGFNEPNSETVQINDGQTTTTTGTYTLQAGSLQVTISPPEAIAAGAQWRVDGGAWQNSGYTEPNLPVGSHTVEYSVIAGWNEPNSETVQINDGQTTTTTGTYTAQAGSLQVTISPQAAIDAGAQWRVDGGAWQNSGYTEPNLAVGSHTVEYSVIAGWNEPNSETVQINDGQTTTTTGTYTAQAGSLQVTISPQAAIDAGAQWRVDGGAWQNSGYTEPNLAVGSHTVEYSVIAGWNEPNSETVQINDGQTTTTTGTYTAQAGSLHVTISPQAAIDAGAKWRVDSGPWQDSGYTEPNLAVGTHTVEYSVITGWNEPNSETVQINDGQTTTTTGTYTAQAGSLQVTISPQAAIDAGAQWRIVGGVWRDSNDTEPNLAVGSYTVEFSVVSGWNEPSNQAVQINDGQTTTTTGTYTAQAGSLQVTISPQAAIDAGAQWRVDDGAWQDSGYTEPNLAVGSHTVEYSVITGWNEPNSETVQINDGQTTTTTGTYTTQGGSLQVTISPQAAIDAGAQWHVDGGAWQNSGYTEPNLTVGTHTVEYSVITGWNEPNSETVQINDGQTTTTTGTYTAQAGSLQVTISPQAAIDAGAQWRVDGGAWQNSGYTEPNLALGTHTVEYSVITGWNEPNSETVQINDGQTTTTTGTYTAQAGSLQVTISPQAAIDAGAQWRVDGGAWQNSGYTEPNLAVGSHTVEYSVIAGWNEPNSETVQINDGQTTITTGTYTPTQAGSLQVTISPQAAIDAGAQWRIVGGVWRDSNDTEPNLAVGSYTVEFSVVSGWNEPSNQAVQINDGQTTTTTGTYTAQGGSLQVTISPQAAIDAGAQWRVDGGAWKDSGYTEPNLAVGSHTVEYSVIAGWNEPNSETVQINDGQTTTTTGTYTAQAGSLHVTISPQAAIDAGAKWRVDSGPWQDSGYTEPNLAVGTHTVEYSVITGWNEPNSETVQINDGQTTTTTGTYTAQAGSLQVTISPQAAIDAGAQWRVDGGPWHDSNEIESGLVVGPHTVEYKPLTNWNEPNNQVVQIDYNDITITTGTYIPTGSLQVTILPQEAVDAGAQWRIVGGVWRDSNDTEPNLAIGSYTVEYKWIFGWNEPNSETVQINYGQITTTTGTYIQQTGSLNVIILPQEAVDANAQWRVDSGPWRDSNDTEPNLTVGIHTVEYSVIAGWDAPNNQTVQIIKGQTTTTSATYIRQTGSLQVTILPQEAIDAGAQWRVDGGSWRDSNDTEPNLVVGFHTVEYKTIFGWDEPNSQTVQINDDQTTTTSGTYIRQRGSLQVTILPQEAVDGGAQWRVDGGIWRDSNDIATNLTVGSHTVEYKPITNNWKEPDSQTVQINDGLTTMVTGTYAPTGFLQVIIYPQAAIDAGAQWCVDGGAWRDSGYTEPNLVVGSHTIDYKPITAWNEPNSRTVQITNRGDMIIISDTYVRQKGALKVTILPQEAADAGAQWRVDAGPWQDSNDIVTGILVGLHTVEYKSITNWNTPANQTVQIYDAQTTTTSGTYIPTGSLQVIIFPQAAIDAGAQWRIDRGIWRDSAYIETGISAGAHTLEYKPVDGWNTPPNETVQIEKGQMTTRIATYIPKGSLQVKIFPQEAVDANAQWRVDGGPWHDSNEIVTGLVVGSHTVEYKPITNWNEPNNQVVQIDYNDITITTGTYIPTGSLQVTILPQEAVDIGAQWRVNGGIWRDTNDIEIGLSVGSHTVEYKPLTGWNSPEPETVQINHGQTTTTTGTYVKQIGSLQVIIFPQEAIDANAQWRVDGGPWHDSNDIVTDLTVGTHRIDYSTIFGWDKPPNETLEIYLDQTTITYGTYVRSRGSLQVTILPPEANDANAQWRVDGGAWHDSNDIVTDLLVLDTHTVEFKPISNWKEPNSQTVQINDGQTTITSGTYIQAGSLQVTIFPQEAVDANAQWRVDSGQWQDSNDIETNLVVGTHTVEFKPITDFNEPNSQTVQIDFAQTTTTSGTYIPTGSLQVTILPQEAIDANAQWRVDGGPWRDSNDIESDLAVGSYTVDYKTIFGFNEPNSQTVQINHAQTTTTTGTYIRQRGSLQVIILPQAAIDANAQWRVDGGAWHDSNDTEPNLAVGLHIVEYKPITNWNEPNSETVMINYGLTTTTSGTYIQAGSVQVTIFPQEAIDDGAQWRVDGRAWRDSNDIETNLAIGMHTVEYKQISSWNEPNSETLLINFGQKTTTSGTYIQSGSLQVTISPPEAIDANAQWRLDGGSWHDSNEVVTGIPIGSYTVDFKPIFGWTEPNSQTVQIDHGQKTTTSGTYIRQIGSLQVKILPPEANDANAQWRVDGGAWRDSNDIVDLAVGSYTVEFKPITDFNEPNSRTVQINQDQTTSISGTYIPIGSLKVIILQPEALDPNDANNAGAQWRVDDGPWHDSNEIQTGIPVGSHTVEYKPIYGWNEPNSQTVQIDHAQMTTTTGIYIRQRGSLLVTILPTEANDAGAQWRVDGGPWLDSNDTEPNLAVGLHTVAYKPITNWIEPNSHTVQIDYRQTTAISKTYIRSGVMQVTILPQEAVDAGAQWRVDGGSWRNSNAISRPLTVGPHTVDYKPLPNWNEPNSHTVQINHAQVTTATSTYIFHSGSLRVIILPPEANDANAQWRVDGGFWHDSNDIEPNLAVGFHTVEFKPIGNAWIVPAQESVQIFNEQTTTFTITYIKRTPIGPPPIQWQTNIGVSDWEYGESVQQTSDGGYITVGHVFSNVTFDYDICLTKTDPDGNIDWQKFYGGDDWDLAYSVVQTSDGGYAIAGYTYSYGNGQSDIYLLKISPTGRLLWDKYFGGEFWDEGYSLQETSDGGFVIVGTTRSFGAGEYDVYLIKTLSNGNKEFEQTFGGAGDDNGWSIQQTSDGGYIIAGYTESFGAGLRDIYLIKLDPGTELQWQKTYDGTNDDIGYSVRQTADGGYIITGFVSYWCPYEGTYQQDVALIKTDPYGNEQWFKIYPGTDDFCSGDDIGYYIRQTSDGGYIIAGETQSYGKGYGDAYLIKTDPNGKKEWQKAIGDEAWDYATAVEQTTDDGFIVAGTTYSLVSMGYDMYLAKICPDGTSSADFNCDGIVYFEDLQVMASQWLQTPTFPSADIDSEFGDGLVDFFDFNILAHDWLLETPVP